MERLSVISFGSDKEHVKNYFIDVMIGDDEELKSRFEIITESNFISFKVSKADALKEARRNNIVKDLYNHARVGHDEFYDEGEKFVIVRVPQENSFQPLIQTLGAISLETQTNSGKISISGSSDDFQQVFKRDDYKTTQFKTVMNNANASASEVIIVPNFFLGRRLITYEAPNASAFVGYIISGQYEIPALSPEEMAKISGRIKIAGLSVGLAGALGGIAFFGGSILKYGSEILNPEKRFGEALRNYEEAIDPSLFTERMEREEAERAKKAKNAVPSR